MWLAEYGDIPMESCLWLDKSSTDDCTNQHCNEWAPLGHACVQHQTFICRCWFSVLPALSVNGIAALNIFKGSVMKEQFISFLKEWIVRKTTTIIIISNCHISLLTRTLFLLFDPQWPTPKWFGVELYQIHEEKDQKMGNWKRERRNKRKVEKEGWQSKCMREVGGQERGCNK